MLVHQLKEFPSQGGRGRLAAGVGGGVVEEGGHAGDRETQGVGVEFDGEGAVREFVDVRVGKDAVRVSGA